MWFSGKTCSRWVVVETKGHSAQLVRLKNLPLYQSLLSWSRQQAEHSKRKSQIPAGRIGRINRLCILKRMREGLRPAFNWIRTDIYHNLFVLLSGSQFGSAGPCCFREGLQSLKIRLAFVRTAEYPWGLPDVGPTGCGMDSILTFVRSDICIS